ncbi:MAG: glycosyltransferase [Opitutales bacterium]|nr:glycosyltransferase [Opitutales bacterium]
MRPPLLSIAIPAYCRPEALLFSLKKLSQQIEGKLDGMVEVVVSDDCSPEDSLKPVHDFCAPRPAFTYRRYPQNVGLERNLIKCAEGCKGEFLWIFGDDDFLETDDALEIIIHLLGSGDHDFLVLNRSRRNKDLSRLIHENWMRLHPEKTVSFPGLRDYCVRQGFISIIGFISVNIFRREAFMAKDPAPYWGSVYPHLGMMLEAFADARVLQVGRPLVCHRTADQEQKEAEFGGKAGEANFMSVDVPRRNASYFSHPFTRMLNRLMDCGAFSPSDVVRLPERTVYPGLLTEFLIETVTDNLNLELGASEADWKTTRAFFERLPLDKRQREKIVPTLEKACGKRPRFKHTKLTFSAVTPSLNQGTFLGRCLDSVKDQTLSPLEHWVFDPGSTDNSRKIALDYPHVTLVKESDTGQADAVNKGIKRSCADIIAWINADDFYWDNTVFARVAERFQQNDEPEIVYGLGVYVDAEGNILRDAYINRAPETFAENFQHEVGIMQPATFVRREVYQRLGYLREDRHYSMDYEFMIRCAKEKIRIAFIDLPLAGSSYHLDNKTYGQRGNSYEEVCDVMCEHFGYVSDIWLKRYAEFLVDGHDGVLKHELNAGTSSAQQLEKTFKSLLLAFNTGHDAWQSLRNAETPCRNRTRDTMLQLGIKQSVPVHEIPIDQERETGSICYNMGGRRWAYDAGWKKEQLARAHHYFRSQTQVLKETQRDTCVIVGNGPSLKRTDFKLFEGQDLIISNNAFLSEELLQYATYYTVVNYLVAEQSAARINRIEGPDKILPYWMAYCLNPGPDTYFVEAQGKPEFCTDIFQNMSWRHTVTFFNLHLAYGLGYKKAILVGFDHSYVQPPGAKEQEIIKSDKADKNHFMDTYFQGKAWQAADVNMMEAMYCLAKDAYEADGREIINATVGGNLELFKRRPLREALN